MSLKRVAVAMSGGVDSSVAAALLKQSGYEVSGVYMQLWSGSKPAHAALDLEHTCQLLGIPLYQFDLQREFQRLVIDYFCWEYSLGRTPNPCITCNQHIKFGLLLEKALEMGAEYLATGHYVRIEHSPSLRLLKAIDITKDQSYFLYTLGQERLQHLLLPLGGLSKKKVKSMAAELDLPTGSWHDSQDVCFIPDNDYRSFIAEHIALKAGDIVDINGKVLGKHNGLARYTVGPRQGLGLNSSEPLYVLELDAANNRLVVGIKAQALHNALIAHQLSWVSGEAPKGMVNIMAKIRYKAPETAAELHAKDSVAEIRFAEPQWAISPGQSVVFYQGDVVLGGGIIDAVLH